MTNLERKNFLRQDADGRTAHDLGGLDFGPIDRHEHDPALWEKRVDAMLLLLVGAKKNAFKVDALRRTIESYGQQDYDKTEYYEKWIRAIRTLLVEQEVFSKEELEAELKKAAAEVEATGRTVSREQIAW